jgi:hypothetical protein
LERREASLKSVKAATALLYPERERKKDLNEQRNLNDICWDEKKRSSELGLGEVAFTSRDDVRDFSPTKRQRSGPHS